MDFFTKPSGLDVEKMHAETEHGLNGGIKRVYVCVTVLVGALELRKISLMLTWL